MRAGLGLMPRDKRAPVLLVSGAHRGGGATTVAGNLAAAAARAGSRVALLDANLRHPSLHTLFRLPNREGLAEALQSGADPVALLHASTLSGLHVLTAGDAPAEAIDLLGSDRMRAALAAMQAAHDLVVIDAASSAGPDVAALAPHADASVVVARLRGARLPEFAALGQRLRLAGIRPRGVVVTLFDAGGASATPRDAANIAAMETSPAESAQPRPGLRSAK